MRKFHFGHLCAGCCLLISASLSMAQVPTESIRLGSLLDASGIRLSTFGKPLPLPPGQWEVMRRSDSEIPLTGESRTHAPRVSLTLRNVDTDAPVAAMVIDYTPDPIRIRWNGNSPCQDPKAAFVDDFGTTTGSLSYACATAYVVKQGFRQVVAGTASQSSGWLKENLSVLAPYLADIPDRCVWTRMHFNRDAGRSIAMALISRSTMEPKAGDALDAVTRSWVRSTGRAYLDFLEGNASVVPAYPIAFTAQTP